MKYFTQLLVLAMRDQRGATAIEYGLIAALVSTAIVAGVGAVGLTVADMWNFVSGEVLSNA